MIDVSTQNTTENQNIFKKEINNTLERIYPDKHWSFNEFSEANERLAFSVNSECNLNIIEEK